jgi:hypothetical protein
VKNGWKPITVGVVTKEVNVRQKTAIAATDIPMPNKIPLRKQAFIKALTSTIGVSL